MPLLLPPVLLRKTQSPRGTALASFGGGSPAKPPPHTPPSSASSASSSTTVPATPATTTVAPPSTLSYPLAAPDLPSLLALVSTLLATLAGVYETTRACATVAWGVALPTAGATAGGGGGGGAAPTDSASVDASETPSSHLASLHATLTASSALGKRGIQGALKALGSLWGAVVRLGEGGALAVELDRMRQAASVATFPLPGSPPPVDHMGSFFQRLPPSIYLAAGIPLDSTTPFAAPSAALHLLRSASDPTATLYSRGASLALLSLLLTLSLALDSSLAFPLPFPPPAAATPTTTASIAVFALGRGLLELCIGGDICRGAALCSGISRALCAWVDNSNATRRALSYPPSHLAHLFTALAAHSSLAHTLDCLPLTRAPRAPPGAAAAFLAHASLAAELCVHIGGEASSGVCSVLESLIASATLLQTPPRALRNGEGLTELLASLGKSVLPAAKQVSAEGMGRGDWHAQVGSQVAPFPRCPSAFASTTPPPAPPPAPPLEALQRALTEELPSWEALSCSGAAFSYPSLPLSLASNVFQATVAASSKHLHSPPSSLDRHPGSSLHAHLSSLLSLVADAALRPPTSLDTPPPSSLISLVAAVGYSLHESLCKQAAKALVLLLLQPLPAASSVQTSSWLFLLPKPSAASVRGTSNPASLDACEGAFKAYFLHLCGLGERSEMFSRRLEFAGSRPTWQREAAAQATSFRAWLQGVHGTLRAHSQEHLLPAAYDGLLSELTPPPAPLLQTLKMLPAHPPLPLRKRFRLLALVVLAALRLSRPFSSPSALAVISAIARVLARGCVKRVLQQACPPPLELPPLLQSLPASPTLSSIVKAACAEQATLAARTALLTAVEGLLTQSHAQTPLSTCAGAWKDALCCELSSALSSLGAAGSALPAASHLPTELEQHCARDGAARSASLRAAMGGPLFSALSPATSSSPAMDSFLAACASLLNVITDTAAGAAASAAAPASPPNYFALSAPLLSACTAALAFPPSGAAASLHHAPLSQAVTRHIALLAHCATLGGGDSSPLKASAVKALGGGYSTLCDFLSLLLPTASIPCTFAAHLLPSSSRIAVDVLHALLLPADAAARLFPSPSLIDACLRFLELSFGSTAPHPPTLLVHLLKPATLALLQGCRMAPPGPASSRASSPDPPCAASLGRLWGLCASIANPSTLDSLVVEFQSTISFCLHPHLSAALCMMLPLPGGSPTSASHINPNAPGVLGMCTLLCIVSSQCIQEGGEGSTAAGLECSLRCLANHLVKPLAPPQQSFWVAAFQGALHRAELAVASSLDSRMRHLLSEAATASLAGSSGDVWRVLALTHSSSQRVVCNIRGSEDFDALSSGEEGLSSEGRAARPAAPPSSLRSLIACTLGALKLARGALSLFSGKGFAEHLAPGSPCSLDLASLGHGGGASASAPLPRLSVQLHGNGTAVGISQHSPTPGLLPVALTSEPMQAAWLAAQQAWGGVTGTKPSCTPPPLHALTQGTVLRLLSPGEDFIRNTEAAQQQQPGAPLVLVSLGWDASETILDGAACAASRTVCHGFQSRCQLLATDATPALAHFHCALSPGGREGASGSGDGGGCGGESLTLPPSLPALLEGPLSRATFPAPPSSGILLSGPLCLAVPLSCLSPLDPMPPLAQWLAPTASAGAAPALINSLASLALAVIHSGGESGSDGAAGGEAPNKCGEVASALAPFSALAFPTPLFWELPAARASAVHSATRLLTSVPPSSWHSLCAASASASQKDLPARVFQALLALSRYRTLLPSYTTLPDVDSYSFVLQRRLSQLQRDVLSWEAAARDENVLAGKLGPRNSASLPSLPPQRSDTPCSTDAPGSVRGVDASAGEPPTDAARDSECSPATLIADAPEQPLLGEFAQAPLPTQEPLKEGAHPSAPPPSSTPPSSQPDPPQSSAAYASLLAMGFPTQWCTLALQLSHGDIVSAGEWLVDNLDLWGSLPSSEVAVRELLGGGGADNADGQPTSAPPTSLQGESAHLWLETMHNVDSHLPLPTSGALCEGAPTLSEPEEDDTFGFPQLPLEELFTFPAAASPPSALALLQLLNHGDPCTADADPPAADTLSALAVSEERLFPGDPFFLSFHEAGTSWRAILEHTVRQDAHQLLRGGGSGEGADGGVGLNALCNHSSFPSGSASPPTPASSHLQTRGAGAPPLIPSANSSLSTLAMQRGVSNATLWVSGTLTQHTNYPIWGSSAISVSDVASHIDELDAEHGSESLKGDLGGVGEEGGGDDFSTVSEVDSVSSTAHFNSSRVGGSSHPRRVVSSAPPSSSSHAPGLSSLQEPPQRLVPPLGSSASHTEGGIEGGNTGGEASASSAIPIASISAREDAAALVMALGVPYNFPAFPALPDSSFPTANAAATAATSTSASTSTTAVAAHALSIAISSSQCTTRESPGGGSSSSSCHSPTSTALSKIWTVSSGAERPAPPPAPLFGLCQLFPMSSNIYEILQAPAQAILAEVEHTASTEFEAEVLLQDGKHQTLQASPLPHGPLLPYSYAVRERITRHADAIAATISATLSTLTLTLPGPPPLPTATPLCVSPHEYAHSTSAQSSALDTNSGSCSGGGGGACFLTRGLLSSEVQQQVPCPGPALAASPLRPSTTGSTGTCFSIQAQHLHVLLHRAALTRLLLADPSKLHPVDLLATCATTDSLGALLTARKAAAQWVDFFARGGGEGAASVVPPPQACSGAAIGQLDAASILELVIVAGFRRGSSSSLTAHAFATAAATAAAAAASRHTAHPASASQWGPKFHHSLAQDPCDGPTILFNAGVLLLREMRRSQQLPAPPQPCLSDTLLSLGLSGLMHAATGSTGSTSCEPSVAPTPPSLILVPWGRRSVWNGEGAWVGPSLEFCTWLIGLVIAAATSASRLGEAELSALCGSPLPLSRALCAARHSPNLALRVWVCTFASLVFDQPSPPASEAREWVALAEKFERFASTLGASLLRHEMQNGRCFFSRAYLHIAASALAAREFRARCSREVFLRGFAAGRSICTAALPPLRPLTLSSLHTDCNSTHLRALLPAQYLPTVLSSSDWQCLVFATVGDAPCCAVSAPLASTPADLLPAPPGTWLCIHKERPPLLYLPEHGDNTGHTQPAVALEFTLPSLSPGTLYTLKCALVLRAEDEPSASSPTSHPPKEDWPSLKVLTTPHAPLVWDARTAGPGIQCTPLDCSVGGASQQQQQQQQQQQPSPLSPTSSPFDMLFCGSRALATARVCASYVGFDAWSLVRATCGFTCGKNAWSLRIDSAPSAYIFIGCALEGADAAHFLGADACGWGWLGEGSLYHAHERVAAPHSSGGSGGEGGAATPLPPRHCALRYLGGRGGFSERDVVGVQLDCEAGTLAFSLNGTPLGIAFTGIPKGCKVFPAAAFFTRGTRVTLLPPGKEVLHFAPLAAPLLATSPQPPPLQQGPFVVGESALIPPRAPPAWPIPRVLFNPSPNAPAPQPQSSPYASLSWGCSGWGVTSSSTSTATTTLPTLQALASLSSLACLIRGGTGASASDYRATVAALLLPTLLWLSGHGRRFPVRGGGELLFDASPQATEKWGVHAGDCVLQTPSAAGSAPLEVVGVAQGMLWLTGFKGREAPGKRSAWCSDIPASSSCAPPPLSIVLPSTHVHGVLGWERESLTPTALALERVRQGGLGAAASGEGMPPPPAHISALVAAVVAALAALPPVAMKDLQQAVVAPSPDCPTLWESPHFESLLASAASSCAEATGCNVWSISPTSLLHAFLATPPPDAGTWTRAGARAELSRLLVHFILPPHTCALARAAEEEPSLTLLALHACIRAPILGAWNDSIASLSSMLDFSSPLHPSAHGGAQILPAGVAEVSVDGSWEHRASLEAVLGAFSCTAPVCSSAAASGGGSSTTPTTAPPSPIAACTLPPPPEVHPCAKGRPLPPTQAQAPCARPGVHRNHPPPPYG